MAYETKIILDSINTATGDRLTTMQVTYPRFVHSEMLTHRMFSRNSASSRAIPYPKMRQRIVDDPVIPIWWGKNTKGMQAPEELLESEKASAELHWDRALSNALGEADWLNAIGVHKQIVNRVLEPWMWITVIISATEWDNFWLLRCSEFAQPEIRKIADMMQEIYRGSNPISMQVGEWHTPFIDFGMRGQPDVLATSVARCARVSYLNHDSTKPTVNDDLILHNRLRDSKHWSPFEHQAVALSTPERRANFIGWQQYRKSFENESGQLRNP